MNTEQAIEIIEALRCYIGTKNMEKREALRQAWSALREKQEREKGCVWCKENNKVYHDGTHYHFFCSYCGKRLEVEHEN